MPDKEMNPAEAAAEEILKAEFGKAQAELCPKGDQCGIHFRVDETLFDEESEYARLITYVDEFVVVTEDNHELGNPFMALKVMLGGLATAELPPRWETSIFHVGEDGTIGDLSDKSIEERRKAIRYAQTHNEWIRVEGVHTATVAMLRQGMIDVSKPLEL